MRTLLIDNSTRLLDELVALIGGEVIVKSIDSVLLDDSIDVDLIVLSGASHLSPVIKNDQRLSIENQIIKNAHIPIIGICYGCQVIAHTYGAEIVKVQNGEEKLVKISVITPDEIFGDKNEFEVFEAHHYVIKNVPESLVILAESDHGIEIFKHSTFPIYGLQFHPEHVIDHNEGKEIFKNIIKKYFK